MEKKKLADKYHIYGDMINTKRSKMLFGGRKNKLSFTQNAVAESNQLRYWCGSCTAAIVIGCGFYIF